MAYVHLDLTKPVWSGNSGEQLATDVRTNLAALRDMLIAGAMFNWAYSKSGGTDMQPATYLYSYSDSLQLIKIDVTWGSSGGSLGSITQSIYSYSSDNGSNWDVIGTKTTNFDANGVVTTTSWS